VFKLIINELPATFEVTCIGYEPLSIEVSGVINTPVEISMQPAIQQLESITILVDKVIPVYQHHAYSVLDYEIAEDKILILVYRYQLKRSVMLVLSRSGDTLAQTFLPEVAPDKLYKDMLGIVHYFSKKKNAYQCYYDETAKEISFPYCFPVDTLLNTIGPYRFLMNGRLFFEEISPDGFSVNLGYYNRESGKRYLQNAGNPSVAGRYYADMKYFMQPRRPDDTNLSMAGFQMQAFELFFKPKSIARMVKVGTDLIAVFDFTTDSLQVRNSGWKLITSTAFEFHKETNDNMLTTAARAYSGNKWIWRWTILTDDYSGKVYTIFERHGHKKLCNIDLQSGGIVAEYEIPVLFPEKITIYKGEAFFLYKPIGENAKWRLYKMKL